MNWESDDLSAKKMESSMPTLMDSLSFDEELQARQSKEDEIQPGGEISSPNVIISTKFPHIFARIVEFWGSSTDIDDYLGSLVLMTRHDRAGFPQVVLNALLEIWNDHRDQFSNAKDEKCAWESDDHLHKAFKGIDKDFKITKKTGLSGAQAAILDEKMTEEAKKKATF